jgi:hypothetical protein
LAEIAIILLLFEAVLDTYIIRQLAKTDLKALFVAVNCFLWLFALNPLNWLRLKLKGLQR